MDKLEKIFAEEGAKFGSVEIKDAADCGGGVEGENLGVVDGGSGGDGEGHGGVEEEGDAAVGRGEGEEEGGEVGEKMGTRGVEGRLQVGGEFDGVVRVRVRVRVWGKGEVVEMEVGGYGGEACAGEAVAGLAVVGGGADVVDVDAAAGDLGGEVEDGVEVSLRGERDHYYRDFFGMIVIF